MLGNTDRLRSELLEIGSVAVPVILALASIQFVLNWPLRDDVAFRFFLMVVFWCVLFGVVIYNTERDRLTQVEKRENHHKLESLDLSDADKYGITLLIEDRDIHLSKVRAARALMIVTSAVFLAMASLSGLIIEFDKRQLSASNAISSRMDSQVSAIKNATSALTKIGDDIKKVPGIDPSKLLEADLAKAREQLTETLSELLSQAEVKTGALNTIYQRMLEKELEVETADRQLLPRVVTTFGFRIFLFLFYITAMTLLAANYRYHENMRKESVSELHAMLYPAMDTPKFAERKAAFSMSRDVEPFSNAGPGGVLRRLLSFGRHRHGAAPKSPSPQVPQSPSPNVSSAPNTSVAPG